MRNTLLPFCFVAFLFAGIFTANAQLYNYTTDLSGSPASVDANATAGSLTRVNNPLLADACPDGFNSNRFAESTVFAVVRSAVEFTISPNSGYQLNVQSISAEGRRNGKGPTIWRLAYSVDGGATWVNNGSDFSVPVTDCGTYTSLSWDVSDFTTYGSVMVRVYAYGASSSLNGKATMRNIILNGTTSFADIDGDGYTSNVDCDDFNASVNPGITEVCNEIDDNCDGNIDEGVQTVFYADADGDTYGDASSSTLACSVPEGYVSDNTDCDDADASVNPGATEICNGMDDNCDGNSDEGLTFDTWYADTDGDFYGDASISTSTCDGAPEGYVSDNTDCNDGDASVNPGATEICNGVDDNCDGNIDEGLTFDTWYADTDGDFYGDASISTSTCDGAPSGYVSDATDCNDGDASVNPGATEICNGVDDNCDGNIDEGLTFDTWYADADGDGYGDALISTSTCDGAPSGYVSDATDCNDGDASVNPGATEICNGVDDNCDGNIDEGVQTVFYADADGDTYGDAGSSTLACSAPEGYVSDNTDCNDGDASVNPGATEICNGVDDNCDGNIDEGLTFDTWYADADGDVFGDASISTSTCNGAPEGYVSDNTDCDDADASVNPGATEICNGVDDNCDGNIDEGVQTTFYADADGDTYGDAGSSTLACSAPEGYVPDETDCDDADASVNPGATEICNGVDDNCDGNIDEGVQTVFYADADGDTYGDAGSTTLACSAPEGYVPDETDCDDADASVNPGATEICNALDDNCDGNSDEGLTFDTWYADTDGDSYGDAGTSTSTCDGAPEGYVSDNTDCNDGDASVNPGATEICNGVDDNCDGNIDEGVQTVFYADADGDTYGDAGSTTLACSAPEGYVSDNTDCDDADASLNLGATEICNGVDDNCDGNIDEGLTFDTWYADTDGDVFGDASISTSTCDGAPEGYVSDNTDCNDGDASVNPGATEICNGVDDNCDGNIDEGVQSVFYADTDGDTYGDAGSSTLACSTPEGYVSDNTDCNDGDASVNPVAIEICANGIDDDCDGAIDVVSEITALGSTTICIGNSVTLQCTTGGTGLSYQWYKNGNPVGGATNSSYDVTLQGNYKCTVTKGICVSTSAIITITVNLLPNATIATPDGLDLCGHSNLHLKANNAVGQTYLWYKDGVSTGITMLSYYANSTGNYYVVVTNANGCSKQSATVTVFSSCRIGENSDFSMNLNPNPTDGNFEMVLATTQKSGDANIMITDMAGKIIYSNTVTVSAGIVSESIQLDNVSGMYMVVVEFNGNQYHKQLVVSK